ncbi:MAG: ABC transporter permease, partial [Clostridiales bacterium]
CLYGARFDLGIAICAVIVSLLFGVPLGAYLGYRGGYVDEIVMRILDAVQSFPSFVLAMLIISTVGQHVTSLILVIGFVNFPSFTRLIRAEMMSRKESQFVDAARCLGNSTSSIIFKHILPNCTSPIINQAALTCGWSIITTA